MEEKRIRMHRQGCIHAQFSMCPVSNILSLYGIKSTTLPSPFPALRAAGSLTRGRVWEGVKNGISYTIKLG